MIHPVKRLRGPLIIASWNLLRVGADLAAHLECLERAGELWDMVMQSEDFLEQ